MPKLTLIPIVMLCCVLLGISCNTHPSKTSSKSFYELSRLNPGEVLPRGWIYNQIQADLREGYYGSYDALSSFVNQELFVKKNRNSRKHYDQEKEWWSGEHEGYWKDGILRSAYLVNDSAFIIRSSAWIDSIFAHVDTTYYIGIYEKSVDGGGRLFHEGENGELWTQSRIFQAMVAYVQYTHDKEKMDIIDHWIKRTMRVYMINSPFEGKNIEGGVSHGIGFFDVLEEMYRITKNPIYLTYTRYLWEALDVSKIRDRDLFHSNLRDSSLYFQNHGAHIAEGFVLPYLRHQITQSYESVIELDNAFKKLLYHTTPGGAMRCDENVRGRAGTADEPYEYCGIVELINPMNKAVSLTNNMDYVDYIEKMVMNAGQGARLENMQGLTYLTTDNRFDMDAKKDGERETFDVSHKAAACCTLNGGRLLPYYVEGMWMKDINKPGLTALLLGPSEIRTVLGKDSIVISEETSYPFSDTLKFVMKKVHAHFFYLSFRRPYSIANEKIEINAPQNVAVEYKKDRIILFNSNWVEGEEVEVIFHFDTKKIEQPQSRTVSNSGYYLQRGALVYALPIAHRLDTLKHYYPTKFVQTVAHPLNKKFLPYGISKESEFVFCTDNHNGTPSSWVQPNIYLWGNLITPSGKSIKMKLFPEGSTVLRQVTFNEK